MSTEIEHGGALREGKRKVSRPFAVGKPIQIILRSSRAKGKWSMLKPGNTEWIEQHVLSLGERFKVSVERFENRGSELEIILQTKKKESMQNYLRTLGALVSRKVSGAKRGNPVGKFWDGLAYSKVIDEQP